MDRSYEWLNELVKDSQKIIMLTQTAGPTHKTLSDQWLKLTTRRIQRDLKNRNIPYEYIVVLEHGKNNYHTHLLVFIRKTVHEIENEIKEVFYHVYPKTHKDVTYIPVTYIDAKQTITYMLKDINEKSVNHIDYEFSASEFAEFLYNRILGGEPIQRLI